MQYFLVWVILSICCAILASKRGRSEISWFFISILISPLIGFVLLLVMDDLSDELSVNRGDKKKCMYCAETIQADAIKCKHCGSLQSGKKPEELNEKELNALIENLRKK